MRVWISEYIKTSGNYGSFVIYFQSFNHWCKKKHHSLTFCKWPGVKFVPLDPEILVYIAQIIADTSEMEWVLIEEQIQKIYWIRFKRLYFANQMGSMENKDFHTEIFHRPSFCGTMKSF